MNDKVTIQVYLPVEERDKIQKNAESAGMSLSSYSRFVLKGAEIRQRPETDVPGLLIEIRRSGETLRKLLEMAYTMPDGYEDSIRKALEENIRAEQMISDAYGMICP